MQITLNPYNKTILNKPVLKSNPTVVQNYQFKESRKVAFAGRHHYRYSNSDHETKQLKIYIHNFKTTGSLADKNILINHEIKMLIQEIEHPEIYYKRVARDGGIRPKPASKEDLISKTLFNAINGLAKSLHTMDDFGIKIKNADSYYNVIQKILTDTSVNEKSVQLNLIHSLSYLYKDISPEYKEKAEKLMLNISKNSSNSSVQAKAGSFFVINSKYFNESNLALIEVQKSLFEKFNNQETKTEDKTNILVNMVRLQSPDVKDIIYTLIKNPETDTDLKAVALWGAGMIKTDENFNLLSDFINSESFEGYGLQQKNKLKEWALNAISEYADKKPKEVTDFLQKAVLENTECTEIAQALLERIHYEDKEDYFIKKYIPDENEQKEYKSLRNRYVKKIDQLSTEEKNFIDKTMLPFRKILGNLVENGLNIIFPNGTVTDEAKEYVGERVGDGRFFDACCALIYNKKNVVVSKELLFLFPHEFNHSFLFNCLDKTDNTTLLNLYKKAIDENKCLDKYGAWNHIEYFAQGYNAFCYEYPNKFEVLPYVEDYNHDADSSIKSFLKQKDPDLYEFIKHCINKYGNPETIKA
jgi:hypothetical protein